jgi:hypothetical protein
MASPSQRAVSDSVAPPLEPNATRTLAHKRFPENALLTDIRACAENHFLCAGRIPIEHRFFNDRGRVPCQDILFYTEVGRQASLAVTHAFLDVSLDDVFIFEHSEAAVTDAIWRVSRHSSPDSVAIEIKVRETVRRKNNVVSRVIADHLMFVDDEPVFQGTGTWTIQSAALFKRLRRTSEASSETAVANAEHPDPLAPYPSNVVISTPEQLADGTGITASLIVDRTHPYFFDHPCDHVPGMLLLEGCAQLAQSAVAPSGTDPSTRAAIMAYEMDFTQFVECTLPTTLTARVGRGRPDGLVPPFEIVVSQRGTVAGVAKLTVGFSS